LSANGVSEFSEEKKKISGRIQKRIMDRWFRNLCQKFAHRNVINGSTYRDLLTLAESFPATPARRRIVVSGYNDTAFLAQIMALWKHGSVPCLVPPQMPPDRQRHCIDMVHGTFANHPDEAMVLFTSSSSGRKPKGVRLSHENLTSHIGMLREHVSDDMFGDGDRTFAFLPWTHCYGLMGECFSVMDRGATMNTLQGRFHPLSFLWGMQKTRPTVLFVVPRVLTMLYPYPKWMWGGQNLRYIVSGGARLDNTVKTRFMRRHDIPVLQGYGMTEMSPMVSLQNQIHQA